MGFFVFGISLRICSASFTASYSYFVPKLFYLQNWIWFHSFRHLYITNFCCDWKPSYVVNSKAAFQICRFSWQAHSFTEIFETISWKKLTFITSHFSFFVAAQNKVVTHIHVTYTKMVVTEAKLSLHKNFTMISSVSYKDGLAPGFVMTRNNIPSDLALNFLNLNKSLSDL